MENSIVLEPGKPKAKALSMYLAYLEDFSITQCAHSDLTYFINNFARDIYSFTIVDIHQNTHVVTGDKLNSFHKLMTKFNDKEMWLIDIYFNPIT